MWRMKVRLRAEDLEPLGLYNWGEMRIFSQSNFRIQKGARQGDAKKQIGSWTKNAQKK